MYRRGGRFFHRHYYAGPDGGVFFYDDPVSPDDPSLAAPEAVAALPTCPPDADDCQGFGDAAPPAAPVDSMELSRAQALEFLRSRVSPIPWREDGIVADTDDDGQETIEPYQGWRVTVEKRKVGFIDFGDERLMLNAKSGFYNVITGSYDKNKVFWNQIVSAVRTMGVRATPPNNPDERDIMSVPYPFRP